MKTPKAKELPSGSWFVRVMVNGKSVSITRPTEKEAIAEALAIKYGYKQETYSSSKMTVADAYERYISAKEGVLSPSTVAGYIRLSRNTFQELMPIPLCKLTNEKIQCAISNMALNGKSPKYISNAQGLLSTVLKMFRPEFHLNVSLPQKKKRQPRKITGSEMREIIGLVKGQEVELPLLMALWMGMRLSEVRGARFEDIKDGKLHICNATVLDINNNPAEKIPKTYEGDRWVDIPEYIMKLINALPYNSGTIVRMTGSAIYHKLSRLCEKNGIEHCTYHDLRHANAAVMVRLKIESKYAQERNGWASDRMYKQVYAYTMDDEMDEVDSQINDYFEKTFVTNLQ